MTSKDFIVFVYLPGEVEAMPAGTLSMTHIDRNNRYSKFVYSTRYTSRPDAIVLDPVSLDFRTLPRRSGEEITPVNNLPFFGAFVDATPDAWGRRIVEKRLNISSDPDMPEYVYVENSLNDRVGALDFRQSPSEPERYQRFNSVIQLPELIGYAEKIEKDLPVPEDILALFRDGSSMGGARPKAVVEDKRGLWIAKFPSGNDRFDHAYIESATLNMAAECGIVAPEHEVISVSGVNVLMVKRFDREKTVQGYTRKHFVSALTMLGRHETESHLSSYAEISAAIAKYARAEGNGRMRAELFRRMVFNILVYNNDDHLKNFGFLYDDGGFVLSPAYDILPMRTVTGERYQHLSVGSNGKLSTLDNAMSQPGIFGLMRGEAAGIIRDMAKVVSNWRELYAGYGVSKSDIEKIGTAFRMPVDIGLEKLE